MNRIFEFLTRLQNPFMKWLLRSSSHESVSGTYMLLIVTGRKSGQRYEIPVQYHQEGSTVWVVTREKHRWWRNLRGGAAVSLRLRGHLYEAYATSSLEQDAVIAALKRIVPSASAERAAQLAQGAVALEIELQPLLNTDDSVSDR